MPSCNKVTEPTEQSLLTAFLLTTNVYTAQSCHMISKGGSCTHDNLRLWTQSNITRNNIIVTLFYE